MGLKNAQVFCVYRHVAPNGKSYIGITSKKPEHRWNHGKAYKQNRYFTNAINQYGWDAFRHEIIFEGLEKKDACAKEIELIAKYKTNNPEHGYNLSSGGEASALGAHWTQASRDKAAKAKRGKRQMQKPAKL